MRIAFYAPLKPPSHPVPSGDRRIARLLLQAMRRIGHEVRVVSTFRAYEGKGDHAEQERLRQEGAARAERLLRGPLKRWKPDLWFTYHLYHKAPDWLGPPISKKRGIPYIVAEASYAPRRAAGRWDTGLAAVAAALRHADYVFLLNPNDEECVAPFLRKRSGAVHDLHQLHGPEFPFAAWRARAANRPAAAEPLLPFVNTGLYWRASRLRDRHRTALARRSGSSLNVPWLLAVGMMRPGDKLASYRVLARALGGLEALPWELLVVGDGPARDAARRAFAGFGPRVHWLGAVAEAAIAPIYAACDLLVWPAINEAIGMAILEAQAAGLPAVVGDGGAISVIVNDETGMLTPEGDVSAFRHAVAAFLGLPGALQQGMRRACIATAGMIHDLDFAAAHIDLVLRRAVERKRKRRRP